MSTRFDSDRSAGATPSAGEPDAPLEAWTPEEFDHFTDLGLLRTAVLNADERLAG